ncbi:hypothetical protein TNCV_2653801 [Trichonephila clavipes]|nr:hypothetical protein TNCV_2653801 [Trichonephila clavipes]
MFFSVFNGSETTACLERTTPTVRRKRPCALRCRQTRDEINGWRVIMGKLDVKKEIEKDEEREPLTSDIRTSASNYLGIRESTRMNADREASSQRQHGEIEQASSNLLGVESPSSNVFPTRNE